MSIENELVTFLNSQHEISTINLAHGCLPDLVGAITVVLSEYKCQDFLTGPQIPLPKISYRQVCLQGNMGVSVGKYKGKIQCHNEGED